MLDIHKLSIHFKQYDGGLRRRNHCPIQSLDLRVDAGQVVAVVGASGAGKSLLAHALLGILPANSSFTGEVTFKGRRVTPAQLEALRGREIALIPQAVTFLNPLVKVGPQVARAAFLSGLRAPDVHQASTLALNRYGLAEEVSRHYPFQLSGGMARRVLTATATIGKADLLVADEPTNGLDADNSLRTLMHLRELADSGKAVVLITHDIVAALKVADKVSVFCGGVTVEEAWAADFNVPRKLRHPYTRALYAALPGNRFTDGLPGSSRRHVHGGCPHSSCCLDQNQRCRQTLPPFTERSGGKVRCWHA